MTTHKIAFFAMALVDAKRLFLNFQSAFSVSIALIDDENADGKLSDFKEVISTKGMGIGKLAELLSDLQIDSVCINAYRIADLRLVLAARRSGCSVVYIQHGLYIPYMKRSIGFYISSMSKCLRYLKYCFEIGWVTKQLHLSIVLILDFVFGTGRASALRKCKFLHADVALVWSEYWKAWHVEQYGMDCVNRWITIGNQDLIKHEVASKDDTCVLYIYQTLVEDGRISSVIMKKYYKELISELTKRNIPLYVKAHPRADSNLLKELEGMGAKFTEKLFRKAIYVGHYSTLLGVAPQLDSRVVVHELGGHQTPPSIRAIAHHITDGLGCASQLLPEHLSKKIKTEEATFFFGGEPKDLDFDRVLD